MLDVAVLVGAYLAGSFPTGVVVARARGVDITRAGSGNIGATNVARTLGKPLGALVLFIDALKGFVPVYLARRALLDPYVIAGAGLLAILGHVFPVWLRFRGGKGVATGLGVFAALAPLAAAVAAGIYLVLYAVFRISSVGSLVAATSLPVVMRVRHEPWQFIALAAAAWFIVVVRHRGNIRRLVRREEKRV